MRGFTLVEVIVVAAIFVIGGVGALALITQNISVSRLTTNQQIALGLAQEGLEIVRNIRDTNFIQGNPWDQGLDCPGFCEADYTDNALVTNDRFLLLDANNFYTYNAGTPTPFKRKIKVEPDASHKRKVTVTVSWEGGGNSIVLASELYKYVEPDPGYEYRIQGISPL